jgi:hypothetical protein
VVLPDKEVVLVPSKTVRAVGEPAFLLRFWRAHAGDMTKCQLQRGASMSFFLQAWNPELAGEERASQASIAVIYGPTALLTYQGEWGVLDPLQIIGYERGLSADQLVDSVRKHPRALEVWNEFRMFAQKQLASKVHNIAATAELCMGTYGDTGSVRMHLHMWIDMGRKTAVPASTFQFLGSTPHVGFVPLEASTRIKFSGAFYVTVDKIGSLWSWGNMAPWKNYAVDDRWITNLFAQGKLSMSVSTDMYLLAVNNAQTNVRNLEFVQEHIAVRQTVAAQAAARRRVTATYLPWRHLPQVHKWAQQLALERDRYKFLVLDGPSRIGKTRFAEGLVAEGRSLVVDCAGAVTPDGSGFSRKQRSSCCSMSCTRTR